MSIADLRQQVAEAAAGAVEGAVAAEGTAEAEATAGETPDPSASEGGTSANGSEAAAGTPEAGDGTEVPTEYFGYKFPPDLTPEQRGEILAELKKRDDTIGTLLRGKTPEEKAAQQAAAPAEEAPEPLTDADILQALGLDPENPFEVEQAKSILPVVRKQIEQDQMIGQLMQMQELNDIDRTWRQSLSGLEKEFGALPAEVTHDDVMEYAAEKGIADPLSAYWSIVGPGRSSVESVASSRLAALQAAKAASATTRPGGGAAGDEAPLTEKSVKGATREAASRILREMGFGD